MSDNIRGWKGDGGIGNIATRDGHDPNRKCRPFPERNNAMSGDCVNDDRIILQ